MIFDQEVILEKLQRYEIYRDNPRLNIWVNTLIPALKLHKQIEAMHKFFLFFDSFSSKVTTKRHERKMKHLHDIHYADIATAVFQGACSEIYAFDHVLFIYRLLLKYGSYDEDEFEKTKSYLCDFFLAFAPE